MLRFLVAIFLLYATTVGATAQSAGESLQSAPRSPLHSVAQWPASKDSLNYEDNIEIVTLSKPTLRQSCHVRKITADSIACRSALHHRTGVYQRDDIAALIHPPRHATRDDVILDIVVTAVALTASFFVPFAWAVVLRVAAGITGWGALFDSEIGGDHNNDILIYQRAGTSLTVTLHP